MLSKVTVEKALLAFAMLVLILNAAFKLAAHETIVRAHERDDETPLWRVERKEVALEIDSWTRYHLSSGAEWAPLFPEGGVVHLGPSQTPYTVAMMHELRCLDVIREKLSRPKLERDAEPTRHCLNYLRQMLTCRGDLQLDMFQYPHRTGSLHPHAIRRCKDWRSVYEKVWGLQKTHRALLGIRHDNASATV